VYIRVGLALTWSRVTSVQPSSIWQCMYTCAVNYWWMWMGHEGTQQTVSKMFACKGQEVTYEKINSVQVMLKTSRVLNYYQLFSYLHDNHFKREQCCLAHIIFKQCHIVIYLISSLKTCPEIVCNNFQILWVSIRIKIFLNFIDSISRNILEIQTLKYFYIHTHVMPLTLFYS
jgi:hypothetical protein